MVFLNTNDVFMPVIDEREIGKSGDISRLFVAALIDQEFCKLLLTRPDLALDGSFNGEEFLLNFEDKQFLLKAKSASLAELTRRWIVHLSP